MVGGVNLSIATCVIWVTSSRTQYPTNSHQNPSCPTKNIYTSLWNSIVWLTRHPDLLYWNLGLRHQIILSITNPISSTYYPQCSLLCDQPLPSHRHHHPFFFASDLAPASYRKFHLMVIPMPLSPQITFPTILIVGWSDLGHGACCSFAIALSMRICWEQCHLYYHL